MSEYFPKLQSHKENIKIKFDLSNYATKADVKYYSCRYFKFCIKKKFS